MSVLCSICGEAIVEPCDVAVLAGSRVHLACLGETPPRSDRPEALVARAEARLRPRTHREGLDAEMREILAQLSTCSHVPASGYQPTGRSRSSDEKIGGSRPPGDLGEAKYARKYGRPFNEPTPDHPGADTDERRRKVIDEAATELSRIRGRGVERPDPTALETEDQLVIRMLTETEGWTPEEVEASSFRMPARLVRRFRTRHTLNPETGKPPTEVTGHEAADAEQRVARARELDDQGFSVRQIALMLRTSVTTVKRDLGRRKAA